jgi:hypothetical protein
MVWHCFAVTRRVRCEKNARTHTHTCSQPRALPRDVSPRDCRVTSCLPSTTDRTVNYAHSFVFTLSCNEIRSLSLCAAFYSWTLAVCTSLASGGK